MTYKQIEASREIRLWIGQLIVPAVTTVITLMAIPQVRSAVSDKFTRIKMSIENKIRKD